MITLFLGIALGSVIRGWLDRPHHKPHLSVKLDRAQWKQMELPAVKRRQRIGVVRAP
jgi:hypothetical protein